MCGQSKIRYIGGSKTVNLIFLADRINENKVL